MLDQRVVVQVELRSNGSLTSRLSVPADSVRPAVARSVEFVRSV